MDKKKVLVIEDSSSQAMEKKLLLERAGVDVLLAPNGWVGIEMAQANQPDVIILDVEMPEIDGFEVCRRLKTDPQTARIPIIMNTIRDFAPDLLLSFEMGAIDFIPKDSFSGPVLIATLQELGIIPGNLVAHPFDEAASE